MSAPTAFQRCLRTAEHAQHFAERLARSTDKEVLEAAAVQCGQLADRYSDLARSENDLRARRVFQALAGRHADDELTIRARLTETRR